MAAPGSFPYKDTQYLLFVFFSPVPLQDPDVTILDLEEVDHSRG